jgi:hypothetical protein
MTSILEDERVKTVHLESQKEKLTNEIETLQNEVKELKLQADQVGPLCHQIQVSIF